MIELITKKMLSYTTWQSFLKFETSKSSHADNTVNNSIVSFVQLMAHIIVLSTCVATSTPTWTSTCTPTCTRNDMGVTTDSDIHDTVMISDRSEAIDVYFNLHSEVFTMTSENLKSLQYNGDTGSKYFMR